MAYIGNLPTTAAFLTDQFSGNGSTTNFTMSVAPATTSSILVNISGVTQDPSTYAVVGTTLTFSAAPPSGTGNISVRYLGIPASGVATTAYRTVTEFTATASQTTFSVPSYTVGYISVYRNGVMLGSADYTATSGTTVVLASGATAGDLVTTESFYVSSVLNAIPATAGAVNSTYITDSAVTQAKLAANVAGNGPAFSAYANTGQTVANNTYTKVAFQVEDFDTNNNFDLATNYRFQPTVAGYYQINGATTFTGLSVNVSTCTIYKNGSAYANSQGASTANGNGQVVSTVVYLNGSTDYVELYTFQNSTVSGTTYTGNRSYNWFSGSMVRAA